MTQLRPKLVAVDLDGTFLDKDSRVSPANARIPQRLADQGIAFVVASGRILSRFPQGLRDLPGLRYVLTANGASVRDLTSAELVHADLLEAESLDRFLAAVEDLELYFEVYAEDESYVQASRLPYFRENFYSPGKLRDMRQSLHPIPDLRELITRGAALQKIFIPCVSDIQAAPLREIIEGLPELRFTSSGDRTWELNHRSCSKARGLLALGAKLGLDATEIMAFGDARNDWEMLEAVGYPVAMANADAQTRARCRYLAPHHHPDGVAQFLETQVLGAGD